MNPGRETTRTVFLLAVHSLTELLLQGERVDDRNRGERWVDANVGENR